MKFSSLSSAVKSKKGIVLIDKPIGWTSHDVVAKIRNLTGVKRVGHTGTLDPLATGLLIVLVGREFTKKQSEFLKQAKEYECMAQLGLETDSYDIDGKIIAEAKEENLAKITKQDLEETLRMFKGHITQVVPAFSAVKIGGKKLYERARKGVIDLESLPSRVVNILNLELLSFFRDQVSSEVFFKIKVFVSSGTYIRSLIHDVGRELGVGAIIIQLRRTRVGRIDVRDAESIKSSY